MAPSRPQFTSSSSSSRNPVCSIPLTHLSARSVEVHFTLRHYPDAPHCCSCLLSCLRLRRRLPLIVASQVIMLLFAAAAAAAAVFEVVVTMVYVPSASVVVQLLRLSFLLLSLCSCRAASTHKAFRMLFFELYLRGPYSCPAISFRYQQRKLEIGGWFRVRE